MKVLNKIQYFFSKGIRVFFGKKHMPIFSYSFVYYSGDIDKWNAIVISGDNNDLFNANIYCNGVLVEKDDVGGSGTPEGGSVEGPIIPY